MKVGKGNFFSNFAEKTSRLSGCPATFLTALLIVLIWGISGPMFNFNNTWQLVINTGTTIITFLMVFLIQNAQNRDTRAMEIKLDELLRVTPGARISLLNLEELSDEELERIQRSYESLAEKGRKTGNGHSKAK